MPKRPTLSVTLDDALTEEARDAVYAVQRTDPNYTLVALISRGIRLAVDELKARTGRKTRFPKRPTDARTLRSGPRAAAS